VALKTKARGPRPPLQEPEWEVLPPEDKQRGNLESLFRWVAVVMDELLALPGTKFKFGLDPLIGLIPGVGDTASATVSALLLIQAARRGLPKILLARMSLNILINELVGIIPGIGDAFSFWFKSNKRNYQLLLAHRAGTRRATKSDWLFVITVLCILFVIVGAGILVSLLVLRAMIHLLGLH
jgi:hypothetical protein